MAIGGFYVEEGYEGTIGDPANYLSIDPNSLDFAGSELAYIDVNAANITINVNNTLDTLDNAAGLYLLGSNIGTLNVLRGNIGVAALPGETATITTINLGAPVTDAFSSNKVGLITGTGLTLTTWNQFSGTGLLMPDNTTTTVTVTGGQLTTGGAGYITTLNNEGGAIFPNSAGTITTLNLRSGVTDFTGSRTARTVTTPKIWPAATLSYDAAVLTFTNGLAAQGPLSLSTVPL